MPTDKSPIDWMTLALIAKQHPRVAIYVSNIAVDLYDTYHAGCLHLTPDVSPPRHKVGTMHDDQFRLAESGSCDCNACLLGDLQFIDNLGELS